MGLIDEGGRYRVFYKSKTPLHEPRPLIKRKRERIIPSRINLKKATGTLVLNNAYIGRNMKGVEPGDIKKLLILETLPKPLNYGASFHDFAPLSHGGTFTLERILGTVPVETDGSAHFEVPANRSIFFIALDENNQSVKRMHSFTSVMPGEMLSCVGCHEERVNTPQVRPKTLQAMTRAASKIEPVPGVPFTIDFPRDIQPILDKHCIKCHKPKKPKGGIILTGDHGPIFSLSYFSLTGLGYISDGRSQNGNSAPRTVGDSASKLMRILDGTHRSSTSLPDDPSPLHKKVSLSPAEMETIRNWIHIGAPYPGTYAALGTGMIRKEPKDPQNIKGRMPLSEPTNEDHIFQNKAKESFNRRCASCHGNKFPSMDDTSFRGVKNQSNVLWDPHMAFNLTNPEQSPMILAPLSKQAGGRGVCHKEGIGIFLSTDDPDYKTMLAWIEAGKSILNRNKRWDMPGFKPHPYYVREMIRYGILPETFNIDVDKIDVFELDKKYFEMSWYYPDKNGPVLYENKKFKQSLQVNKNTAE